jgi:hypothetical protein
MDLDGLVGFLLTSAICALLAFVAALLLRLRLAVLAYVGAGLLGQGIGSWIGGLVKGTDWPGRVTLGSATVHLLWTFDGALLVLLVYRLFARGPRWRAPWRRRG